MKTNLIVILLSLFLAGCDTSPPKEIGYGVIENGIYKNEYFNMSIEVPEKWDVQSQAANKELMDRGAELIAGDDDNFKKMIKLSQKQSVTLFVFFKHEKGAPVPFNPNIILVAEKMSHMPGVKRGSDYLYHVRKLFESGKMEYEFPHEIYTKVISDISFDVMPAVLQVGNLTVTQDYYATRINDYVLSFILSSTTNLEQDELDKILNKLHFSK